MAGSNTTTLYLRGVPRPLVREAKAAAAREGQTLARWVSDKLARATGRLTDDEEEPDLSDDFAWYEANQARLEQKHRGKYVAIVNRAVVDHDADFEPLAHRVFAKFGPRSVCMPLVGRREVRVRSPRRVAT